MVNREEFIRDLQDLISDDPSMASGMDEEIIYKIDDLNIYGGFDMGIRGVDHRNLLFEGVTWNDIIHWGTVVVPETRSYISDQIIEQFEDLGFENLPTNNNHLMGFKEEDVEEIDEEIVEIDEDDIPYKIAVEFEKSKYEEIKRFDDGEILYKRFENGEVAHSSIFESYELLFDVVYKDRFIDSLNSIESENLIEYFGQENFDYLLENDSILQEKYDKVGLEERRILEEKILRERNKERDLDNDGSPDRIDIDDNRNAVQLISDLDIVKNGTSKEQMQRKSATNDELEL
ncbi:hypothetical protein [Enterococcus sp. AZ196]|uniref:hypothetical protein n=1 Tax=Enterococcus sp. AZ196 TaxID=2774659 RepID=UPI003D2ADC74